MPDSESRPTVESPFASIRELTGTERRLTALVETVKTDILKAIRDSDQRQDDIHLTMREVGDQRHRRIEDFLGAEALDDAKRTGKMAVGVGLIRTLRVINEFRWLVAIAAVVLGLALGGFHVELGSSPVQP